MTKRIPNPTHPSGDAHWTRRTPEKIRRGTAAAGAKLTDAQIAELCARFRTYRPSQGWLARKYGVARITVWRHLKAHGLV